MPALIDIRTVLPAGPHWEVAGIWRRLAAALLDLAVVAGVIVCTVLLIGRAWRALDLGGDADVVVGAVTGLPAFGYLYLTEASRGTWNGQTLGKRLLGIRTCATDGTRPITPRQAALRALLIAPFLSAGLPFVPVLEIVWPEVRPADLAATACAIGCCLAGLTSATALSRRAWYDRLTGTIVLRSRVVLPPHVESQSESTSPNDPVPRPLPAFALEHYFTPQPPQPFVAGLPMTPRHLPVRGYERDWFAVALIVFILAIFGSRDVEPREPAAVGKPQRVSLNASAVVAGFVVTAR